MIVIVRDHGRQETLHCVRSLTVNEHGFCCEVDLKDIVDVVHGLKDKGFDVGLEGKLITLPLTSFSAFDDA